ncbi:hypothetical protein F5Y16DRAFT_116603 [Xylariaceae sp. FL0255]|nr:hypothetical protein F5Y16DRAFT_116603 [Xylariaceae sp. FL0255]
MSLAQNGFVDLSKPRPAGGPPGLPRPGNQQPHPPGPPPRHMLPVDMQYPNLPPINDVSYHTRSESDKIDDLADYRIFRFEKVVDKDSVDDYGRAKWPSWEKAVRTEDHGISKQEAAKKIRLLNKTTLSVIDKKNSLTAPLKQQIDSTLDLMLRLEPEPLVFTWILAQLDHQLRKIIVPNVVPGDHRRRNHHQSSSGSSRRRRSNSHGRHHSKKTAYERLSLTAYFKRIPRPGVDVNGLWNHVKFPQHQPFLPVQPAGDKGQQGQGPPKGPQPPFNGNKGPKGPKPGPKPNNKPNRSSGPDSSSCDSDCSCSGSDTAASSVSGGRKEPGKSPPIRKNQPNPHPKGGHGAGHQNKHPPPPPPPPRIFMPQPPPRPPPYPLSTDSLTSDVERAYREGQREGRMAERKEAREVEEMIRDRVGVRRPSPRIYQEEPVFRVVRQRRRDDDDLARFTTKLSIHDDYDDDDDSLPRRGRRDFEYRTSHGSILEDDPFERPLAPPSSSSSSYLYSHDGYRRGGNRRRSHIIEIPAGPRIRQDSFD